MDKAVKIFYTILSGVNGAFAILNFASHNYCAGIFSTIACIISMVVVYMEDD